MNKEQFFIHKYFSKLSLNKQSLNLKNDAAEVDFGRKKIVISTDMMIEKIHFFKNDPPELLARKLIRINISDLAAMGAKPYGYTLNLAIPLKNASQWINKFISGLEKEQNNYGLKLFGGDLSKSEKIFMSITIFGKVSKGIHLMTSAKKKSDIYVSGNIGDAVFGYLCENDKKYNFIKNKISISSLKKLKQRYFLPKPNLELSQALVGYADACTDISDGLISDLKKILNFSNLGADIYLSKIPISKTLQSIYKLFSDKKKFWELVLNWGEDYELVFSMSSKKKKVFEKNKTHHKLFKVGSIRNDGQINIYQKDLTKIKLNFSGFSHF